MLASPTPSNEIFLTATAFANALSSPSALDALVLRHHTRSLHRASWCLSHIQLPRLLCSECGSFASPRLELRSVPKHLHTLASPKGASEGRPSLSQYRLRILIHLSECARWNPYRRQRSRLFGRESRSRSHAATSYQ